jgi:uncharacterized pyridoxamine 5'-phosphate oxidase family protein
MEELYQYFKENPVFYLATVEGDQPRVRPFGAVAKFDDKLYICTNNKKKVFKQIENNAKVEICSVDQKGNWLRVEAKVISDDRLEAKKAMLDENPGLNNMYKADDDIFEVLYLMDVTANFCSFGNQPRTIEF